MSKKNNDNREKITLRISDDLNEYTKKKASAMGVSQNAFLVMMIDLGLRLYDGEFKVHVESE